MIIGQHHGLHVQATIAVSECVLLLFIWLLLTVHLQVAIAIIDKDADLANGLGLALLDPYNLTVMINRLHTIAGNPYTKISTLWN